jgi:hypothetical protein
MIGEHLVRRYEVFFQQIEFGHARPPVQRWALSSMFPNA